MCLLLPPHPLPDRRHRRPEPGARLRQKGPRCLEVVVRLLPDLEPEDETAWPLSLAVAGEEEEDSWTGS